MWLAIYPALTLTLWLLEHFGLWQLALPLRTLVLTAVLVPTMVYVLMPAVTSAMQWARDPTMPRRPTRKSAGDGCG